jgi:hypothetical protein
MFPLAGGFCTLGRGTQESAATVHRRINSNVRKTQINPNNPTLFFKTEKRQEKE